MMTDIIIIAVVLLIVCAVGWYIYKAKKNGQKCIGCPDAKTCGSSCGGSCSGCTGCGQANAK